MIAMKGQTEATNTVLTWVVFVALLLAIVILLFFYRDKAFSLITKIRGLFG